MNLRYESVTGRGYSMTCLYAGIYVAEVSVTYHDYYVRYLKMVNNVHIREYFIVKLSNNKTTETPLQILLICCSVLTSSAALFTVSVCSV